MSGCQTCTYLGMSTAVEGAFVGVRLAEETNLTVCSTGDQVYAQGERVIIESERGAACGCVERSPIPIFKPCQKANARRVLRRADEEDLAAYERKIQNELSAKQFCRERASNLKLQMKVSKVDFSLDSKAATVYFTADGRIDFRRLVRDVSRRFSAKVRMVQVGARDEAGIIGGVGPCGLTLCCSTWLRDFKPISIQMAKRQSLSLNPSKISGQCGRLLCCLAYEDDQYRAPKTSATQTRNGSPS